MPDLCTSHTNLSSVQCLEFSSCLNSCLSTFAHIADIFQRPPLFLVSPWFPLLFSSFWLLWWPSPGKPFWKQILVSQCHLGHLPVISGAMWSALVPSIRRVMQNKLVSARVSHESLMSLRSQERTQNSKGPNGPQGPHHSLPSWVFSTWWALS